MGVLTQLLDRPIAYNPAFARLRVGNVRTGPVAAVFLSQMVYWHNRMDGGWMYKTQADITSETALSRDEQETARKRLVAMGVLEEARRGVPATMHYRINVERLESLLVESVQAGGTVKKEKTRVRGSQYVETPQSGLVQSSKQDCGKTTDKFVETPPTSTGEPLEQVSGNPAIFLTGDYTENTQEITQENKNPSCPETSPPDDLPVDNPDQFLARYPDAVVYSEKKRLWGSHEDLKCAEWIWGQITRLYEQAAEADGELARPKEPNWAAWANDVRLMCSQDQRTHRQICQLFKRVQSDPFWCRNILSPSKLRDKWDELVLRLGPVQRSITDFSPMDYATPEGFRGY
ncbi:primosomal protein I [Pantoea agglomerans]|uniref:primosomal protein I n=1 Tax=Enterobacter agglomerans TaxID=549 RepID=UPI001654A67C|nr:primosomal protein I [Pantoea agglomerans]